LLHEKGSSNRIGNLANIDKVKFNTLFTLKDLIPLVVLIVVIILIVSNTPNIFGDVENFNKANPLIAPLHIQPEWYFLFAYAILRSFPSKLGGVVSLLFSVLIIRILIFKKSKTSKFRTIKKTKF
jgi:ubiquinol-cytochrome c reductase cytochrome b subunit